jgi:hypothetical protein
MQNHESLPSKSAKNRIPGILSSRSLPSLVINRSTPEAAATASHSRQSFADNYRHSRIIKKSGSKSQSGAAIMTNSIQPAVVAGYQSQAPQPDLKPNFSSSDSRQKTEKPENIFLIYSLFSEFIQHAYYQ